MAVTATINKVATADGKIYVKVGKTVYEFSSIGNVMDFASDGLTKEILVKLLILEWDRRNPARDNPSLIEGVSATFDLDGTLNAVRFSS